MVNDIRIYISMQQSKKSDIGRLRPWLHGSYLYIDIVLVYNNSGDFESFHRIMFFHQWFDFSYCGFSAEFWQQKWAYFEITHDYFFYFH